MRNNPSVYEVQVVPIDDLPMMGQSRNGLPLARVIARWLARVLDAEPGGGCAVPHL
jgi:hypothetical protein